MRPMLWGCRIWSRTDQRSPPLDVGGGIRLPIITRKASPWPASLDPANTAIDQTRSMCAKCYMRWTIWTDYGS